MPKSAQGGCDKRNSNNRMHDRQAVRHGAADRQGGSLRRAGGEQAVRIHCGAGDAQAGSLHCSKANRVGSRVSQRAGNDGGSGSVGRGDRELHGERRSQQVAAAGCLVCK